MQTEACLRCCSFLLLHLVAKLFLEKLTNSCVFICQVKILTLICDFLWQKVVFASIVIWLHYLSICFCKPFLASVGNKGLKSCFGINPVIGIWYKLETVHSVVYANCSCNYKTAMFYCRAIENGCCFRTANSTISIVASSLELGLCCLWKLTCVFFL